MQRLTRLGPFLLQERHWVILLLVYATAWIIPFQWMKDYWFLEYQVTAPQPLVLLGFPFALWGSRARLATLWANLKRNERYSHKRTSEGNVGLLVVGCLLYFFAHFSRLALVGILGLVLMLLGVFVRTYGRRMLKAIPGPIAYLLLVVPWLPETAVGVVNQQSLKIYLSLITSVLNRIGFSPLLAGDRLLVKGVSVPMSFELFGAQGVFAALLFFWAYGLARTLPARRIFLQVTVGMAVAFLVHFLRMLLLCLLAPSNLAVATRIAETTPWVFSALSIALTFVILKIATKIRRPAWLSQFFTLLERLSSAIQRPMDRALGSAARTGQGVGKGVTVLFSPLTWLLDKGLVGIGRLFKVLGSTNKALDKALKNSDRKRQQRKK
ncbi:archaeosortase/exosortase family protein [Armatimonas rosea]|uniref:Exosortase/archaeosortase family protein n=1 Tax=Armatimonas rosea TaxID=685828 RepID=A0A7W9SW94_ARMRO|nr:archaeosortase/exosortase family protein [Armatimonas rosea]MBB6053981.1 hypothetical protein [Armatimonas rosea]